MFAIFSVFCNFPLCLLLFWKFWHIPLYPETNLPSSSKMEEKIFLGKDQKGFFKLRWCTSWTLLQVTQFYGIKALGQLRNTWNWKKIDIEFCTLKEYWGFPADFQSETKILQNLSWSTLSHFMWWNEKLFFFVIFSISWIFQKNENLMEHLNCGIELKSNLNKCHFWINFEICQIWIKFLFSWLPKFL